MIQKAAGFSYRTVDPSDVAHLRNRIRVRQRQCFPFRWLLSLVLLLFPPSLALSLSLSLRRLILAPLGGRSPLRKTRTALAYFRPRSHFYAAPREKSGFIRPSWHPVTSIHDAIFVCRPIFLCFSLPFELSRFLCPPVCLSVRLGLPPLGISYNNLTVMKVFSV